MRKIFILFLFAILFGGGAMAYDFSAVCESGQILYYNITSRTAPYTVEVTYAVYPIEHISSSSYCGDIIIPEHVNYNDVEYSVTRIGYGAFGFCYGLTSVTIPNSVTSIGDCAFAECLFASIITIPNSVTSIGDYAFQDCYGLTSVTIPAVINIGYGAFDGCSGLTSVTIPNSVTSIGQRAFRFCSGLTGALTIPNSVTSIGSSAFSGCSGLTSVIIPSSVTSIGGSAFSYCSGLTSVIIPNSITSIGSYAFYGCRGLTSVTIPNSVTSIGENAFSETGWYNNQPDGILYLDDWCLGYKGYTPTGELTINESTIGIANHAFKGCDITSVTIPNSVTSIGRAFYRNVQINLNPDNTNFRIVDNVLFDYEMTRLIMYMGFQDSYTIPNSVENIDEEAFSGCSGLVSVTIGNSVESIGSEAFYNCSGLTSVTIPNSVTSIGSYAFSGCSGLSSVIIPSSVISIGSDTFSGCSGLTEVTIPNSVTSIGYNAFSGCSGLTRVNYMGNIEQWCGISFGNSTANPISYANNLYLNNALVSDLIIPNTVSEIKLKAFVGATCLTSVTIPNSVTSIGDYAFSGCSGLVSVTIGNSVESIGSEAFYNCSGLTSVTIPNSVTSIGDEAFRRCSGLTSITIGNSVTSIGEKVFDGTGWYEAQSDGILYLDGWCLGYKGDAPTRDLTINEGTKGIASDAFHDCNGLISVTIPNSVEGIGQYAFYANENLDSVSIGINMESIGFGAFSMCTNLRAMSILSPIPPEACYMFLASLEPEDYSATDNIRLYVGCGARDAYMSSNWGGWFSEIREMPDCAGVEENSIENEMELYPNPVGNTLNITSSETISEIEIVNVMGQVVKHMEVNSDNVVCNVEDLKAGVYMVRIYSRPFGTSTSSATEAQGAALRKFVKE